MLLIGFEKRCEQRCQLGRALPDRLRASLVDERDRPSAREKILLDSCESVRFEPHGNGAVLRKHGSIRKQREGFGLLDQARRSRDVAISVEHFDRLALALAEIVLARRLRQRFARNTRDKRARSRSGLHEASEALLAMVAQGCARNEFALHGVHERAPVAVQLPQIGRP